MAPKSSPIVMRGPSLRDWALFGISVMFVIGGLVILPSNWRQGLTTVAFFGACGCLSGARLFARLRQQRREFDRVSIVGGVEIGLDLRRFTLMSMGLVVIGLAFAVIVEAAPLIIRLLGAFVALFGVVFFCSLHFGWLPKQSLTFTPDGIVFRQNNFRIRIAWGEIVGVRPTRVYNNPMVLLDIASDELRVEPESRRAAAWRLVAQNRGVFGADLSIMPRNFGLDDQLLVAALVRYIEEPAAREQLRARAQISA